VICSALDMSCCVNSLCRYSLLDDSEGEFACILLYVREDIQVTRADVSRFIKVAPQRIKQIEEHALRRIRDKSFSIRK